MPANKQPTRPPFSTLNPGSALQRKWFFWFKGAPGPASTKESDLTHKAAGDRMFFYDARRSLFSGIVEAGFFALMLPIAIRLFSAPETLKAFVVASGFIGFFVNPWYVALSERLNWGPRRGWAFSLLVCAAALFVGFLWATLWGFVVCLSIAYMFYNQAPPFQTQLYAQHYPRKGRGRRASTGMLLLILSSSIFAWLGGVLLDFNLEAYRWFLLAMAIAAFCGAKCVLRMPPVPDKNQHKPAKFELAHGLRILQEDKLFAWLILAWTLVGGATTLTTPLRQEYLANPKYGLGFDNETVVFLHYILPSIFLIISIKVWAVVYEKISMATMRTWVNAFLIAGLLLFFTATSVPMLALGAALFGTALGGGKITWSLWVTQLATHKEVPHYMSVHSSMAGLRGLATPFLGYALASLLGLKITAILAVLCIAVSTWCFYSVRKHKRLAK